MNCTNSTESESCLMFSQPVTIFVSVAAALCSLLTVSGNFFVILAFFANRSLRNFSNYLILNLAISDIIIGLFSMNVCIVFNLHGDIWTMGRGMCNAWLTVDYVASNTSVMNLLVICIDRYVAITSPVKYRRRCTPRLAVFVICAAWTISFLLWAPAILLWNIVIHGDSIDESTCAITFMKDSLPVTLTTALGAFYLPAMSMCILYWRVIVKIKQRTSSVTRMISHATAAMETRYTSPFSVQKVREFIARKEKEKLQNHLGEPVTQIERDEGKKFQSEEKDDHTGSQKGTHTAKPRQQDNAALLAGVGLKYQSADQETQRRRNSFCAGSSAPTLYKRDDTKTTSSPDITESPQSFTKSDEDLAQKCADVMVSIDYSNGKSLSTKIKKEKALRKHSSSLSFKSRGSVSRLNREKRATTLLKSILICFVALWLPYNVIVVVTAICQECNVPAVLWDLSYWLCYLNSTVNPFCYGYCNENFQRTFRALLTTKWWTAKGRRKMRCQLSSRSVLRNN